MHRVGLVGGVASGKSLVAAEFQRLGAGILDADRAGHEVLQTPEVEDVIVQRWGMAVCGSDGRIDRSQLAQIVFAPPPEGPRERAFLEALTHPEIGRRLLEQSAAMETAGIPVAVLDAPLLLEAGWDKLCGGLVFVDAPREVRLARAIARGWSAEQFAAREQAQYPVEVKRRRANAVIDNSGPPEQTRTQVERLWRSLVG